GVRPRPHAVCPLPEHRVRRPPGVARAARHRRLVKATGDGTFTAVTDHLDRPTSLEFIGTPPTLSPSAGGSGRSTTPPAPPRRRALSDHRSGGGRWGSGLKDR